MADRSIGERTRDRNEFAAYVAEIVGELAATARHNRLDVLAYLLDMANLEASNIANGQKSGDNGKHVHP